MVLSCYSTITYDKDQLYVSLSGEIKLNISGNRRKHNLVLNVCMPLADKSSASSIILCNMINEMKKKYRKCPF